jgi:hypothetical protein
MKDFYLFLILIFIISSSCARYNRVAVVVRNDTGFKIQRLTLRFGDSLHIVKDLGRGQRSRTLKSNRTFGKGFVKAILTSGDTLLCYPFNRHGEKFYYEGKILVRLQLQTSPLGADTLVTKSRRRWF